MEIKKFTFASRDLNQNNLMSKKTLNQRTISLSFVKNIVLFWLQMAYKKSKLKLKLRKKFGFDFRKDVDTLC